MVRKIYASSHIDMLTSSMVVVMQAIEDKDELSILQTKWSANELELLQARIDAGLSWLGRDGYNNQKRLTAAVREMFNRSFHLFRQLEALIVSSYMDSDVYGKILGDLGYGHFTKRIWNGDQEAMVNWLQTFSESIGNYEADFLARGISSSIIYELGSYSNAFPRLNVSQEVSKVESLKNHEARQVEFNEIYQQVVGICMIARSLFGSGSTRMENYIIRRVLMRMNYRGTKVEGSEKA